ncbi:flagellin [Porticoccaceae bacterium]|nr:flagellin [Porticoccaceae bacterium]MDB4308956.1 flagellin [Porticoccaceae bacterium]MDC0004271.1 flagellin [Porticoccaceae bacterium]
MAVINTNIAAMMTTNALARNDRDMSATMERLSTGKSINSAKDDAAGLAVSSRMTAQIQGVDQAVQNAGDAISMIQTADGASIEIGNMMQRMRELSVQASNGTVTSTDQSSLNLEFVALRTEIDRIANQTQWNGENVLSGAAGTSSNGTAVFQVGANSLQTMSVAFGDWNLDASTSDVTGVNAVYDFTITDTQVAALEGNFVISDGQNTLTLDATTVGALTTVAGLAAAIEADGSLTRLTASDGTGTLTLTYDDAAVVTVAPTLSENGTAGTVAETTVGVTALSSVYGTDISSIAIDTDVGANSAIAALDTAINGINAQRAVFGAGMNRLEYAIDNLTNVSQNASASRSRIEDADYAAETTELARTQIIQQAGTAMLTQANQQAQSVLALLKG